MLKFQKIFDKKVSSFCYFGRRLLIIDEEGLIWSRKYESIEESFVQISNYGQIFTHVSCGNYHMMAIDADGFLWAEGFNSKGQLGIGSFSNVVGLIKVSEEKFIDVKCGSMFTIAIDTNGFLWTVGNNDHGQLGLGDKTNRNKFQKVNETKFIAIDCGSDYMVAIDETGTPWSCGINIFGQLGNDEINGYSMVLKKMKCCFNEFVKVSCGYDHTILIDKNGILWSCGYNYYNQALSAKSIKINNLEVMSERRFKSISCGDYFTMAIDQDGALWACGLNKYSKLGILPLVENVENLTEVKDVNVSKLMKESANRKIGYNTKGAHKKYSSPSI